MRSPNRALLPALLLPALLLAAAAAPTAVSAVEPTARVVREEDALVVEVGPVRLPANAGHGDVDQPPLLATAFPEGGWLTGMEVALVDGRGREIPQIDALHHVNLVLPGRRELFSEIMMRLGAAGEETPALHLPFPVGVPVGRGEPLLVYAMFMNKTPEAHRDVTLRIRMGFTPDDALVPRVSVLPFYLDVIAPEDPHAFDLPPGRSVHSWEGRPAIPGWVLGVGGHLHDYGKRLVFEDVTADEVLWEAEPIEGDDGEVVSMPTETFLWELGLRLDPTHTYRLTAVYENPTDRTIPDGGMGALGGVILPAPGRPWPEPDRDSAQYRADLERLRHVGSASAAHAEAGHTEAGQAEAGHGD